MANPNFTAIHRSDALRLLEDGEPHRLKVWKLTSGEILEYLDAVYTGHQRSAQTAGLKLSFAPSSIYATFADI